MYYTQYINVFSIVCTTSVFDTHAEKRRGEGRLQGHFFGGGETERRRGSKALRERALKAAVATTKAAAWTSNVVETGKEGRRLSLGACPLLTFRSVFKGHGAKYRYKTLTFFLCNNQLNRTPMISIVSKAYSPILNASSFLYSLFRQEWPDSFEIG